jgi:hypothetical protein
MAAGSTKEWSMKTSNADSPRSRCLRAFGDMLLSQSARPDGALEDDRQFDDSIDFDSFNVDAFHVEAFDAEAVNVDDALQQIEAESTCSWHE